MRVKRLAVTMRTSNPDTGRRGDWLDPAWAATIGAALPSWRWFPVPNLSGDSVDLARSGGADAILFTGGEDVGEAEVREATERRLLAWGVERRMPVVGVCRGLQLVQSFFGGVLDRASGSHDAGRVHDVCAFDAFGATVLGASRARLPSYHRHAVHLDRLSPELVPWAVAPDGVVEGLRHRDLPIVAAQWHPERALPDPTVGHRLLRLLS